MSSSPSTFVPAAGTAFDLTPCEERDGFLSFQVAGKGAAEVFGNEAGGHRWQRIPPTEKRGRVHTSTVTVAVLDVPLEADYRLNPDDLEISTTRGSGAGGQHRNKTETVVVIVHKPTGLRVRVGSERSQWQNKQLALSILAARLAAREEGRSSEERSAIRKRQVGSGQRGDKIRTIRTQDNRVTCERTGRTLRFTEYSRGQILFG